MESHNKCRVNSGFTLVELSIVMIIIGLLIGGIFGGMKLIDNANVQKTVQDIKAIESATLTFKDTYRALPGDMRNPSARLPNCATAPCSTGGNGNRIIDNISSWGEAVDSTMEKFTYWQHLLASDILSLNYRQTTELNYGEGQPSSPNDLGYKITTHSGPAYGCNQNTSNSILGVLGAAEADWSVGRVQECRFFLAVDSKMDEGTPLNGRILAPHCTTSTTCPAAYNSLNAFTFMWVDIAF